MVRKLSLQDPSSWTRGYFGSGEPPGIELIESILVSAHRQGIVGADKFALDYEALLEMAIPNNLALAERLENIFVTRSSSEAGFGDALVGEHADRLHLFFREKMVAFYRDQPIALVAKLAKSHGHLLARLCWGLSGMRQGRRKLPPMVDWPVWKELLVAASEIGPDVMQVQIAWMLTRTQAFSRGPDRFVVDSTVADGLFSDSELVAIFSKRSSVTPEPVTAVIEHLQGKLSRPRRDVQRPS